MIRVNLLPIREARRRADARQQLASLALVLAVSLLGVGAFHYSLISAVADVEARIAQMQAQLERYKPQIEKVKAYKEKKRAIEAKLEVIEGLERSRKGPVRMLDALATLAPERLWLSRLAVHGHSLTLEGQSLDNEIVAVFLTALSSSPRFKDVELESTERGSLGKIEVSSFVIHARLASPEEGAEKDGEAVHAAGGRGREPLG